MNYRIWESNIGSVKTLPCCVAVPQKQHLLKSVDNDEEMWRWDQCVLSLSLFCFLLTFRILQDMSELFAQWFFGFTTRYDTPIKRSRDASSSLFTVRRTLLYLKIHWRSTIFFPFVRWVLLLNVLLYLPKPATIFFVGTLWAANRACPTFSQQIHPKHTHTQAYRTNMSNTYAHTVTRPWIWNSISGTIFPSKRLSSWSIILNILECFQIPQAWAIPKVRGHGARAPPSWPHRSTGETVGCFSTGKTYNTRCKRGNDWGLLLGNHVNLKGGMRKSARRNKGASLTTFDPTRCQTLFCCHAESFSCLGWMWLESEKNATGSMGGSIMFHLNIASELQESPSAALPGFSKLDRTWEFSTQVRPTTKPYKTHDCC